MQLDHVHILDALRLILPKDRHDPQRLLLLNQTGRVVAKHFAQHLVRHRRIGLAHDRIPELPLDGGEGRFGVAA